MCLLHTKNILWVVTLQSVPVHINCMCSCHHPAGKKHMPPRTSRPLTSCFSSLPLQEATAEGRKWQRVSQAGYDWNQGAQRQQHPHKARRQQSVKKKEKKKWSVPLATKRTFGSRDQNREKLQHWKIVEWNTISVYNNAPEEGMCTYK